MLILQFYSTPRWSKSYNNTNKLGKIRFTIKNVRAKIIVDVVFISFWNYLRTTTLKTDITNMIVRHVMFYDFIFNNRYKSEELGKSRFVFVSIHLRPVCNNVPFWHGNSKRNNNSFWTDHSKFKMLNIINLDFTIISHRYFWENKQIHT